MTWGMCSSAEHQKKADLVSLCEKFLTERGLKYAPLAASLPQTGRGGGGK